jgi:transcriptional regulator with XRE-family HTH domain
VSLAEDFARNLREARLAAALTQEALGHASGLHPTEVSRLERSTRDARLSTVERLARALGVSAADLLREPGS